VSEFHYSSSNAIISSLSGILISMAHGYLEAAVFTVYGGDGIEVDDEFYPEAVAGAFLVCAGFLRRCGPDIIAACDKGMDLSQIGRDIWFTQNGHGVGFWDRGLGDIGERLSESARSLGEAYVVKVGNDKLTIEHDWSKV
jgi:hypothetical protein